MILSRRTYILLTAATELGIYVDTAQCIVSTADVSFYLRFIFLMVSLRKAKKNE